MFTATPTASYTTAWPALYTTALFTPAPPCAAHGTNTLALATSAVCATYSTGVATAPPRGCPHANRRQGARQPCARCLQLCIALGVRRPPP